ncbi:hypothetical protein HYALB_00006953 [Hymenoscyphus albidus]|uniref:Protein SQS1 n=1 Tax=Hymenoscyphus albidus TaxID=595503 RepID=A0A9N9LCT7_9HELO|nr:hypothetical protein HYALB_00006953 [Hymenoscyphus albidus]
MGPRSAKRRNRRGNFQNAGASRGSPHQAFESPSSFDPYARNSGHGFTLAEEARNTERHTSQWAPRLRDKPISFVNAGTLQPTDPQVSDSDKDAEGAMADMTLNPPAQEDQIEVVVDLNDEDENLMADITRNPPAQKYQIEVVVDDGDGYENAMADMALNAPVQEDQINFNEMEVEVQVEEEIEDQDEPSPETQRPILSPSPLSDEEPPLFVVDTLGSQPVATGLGAPEIRPSSPTPSDSSEEIILFRGRGVAPRVLPPKPIRVARASTIDDQIKVVEEKIHERQELLEEVRHHSVAPPELEHKPIIETSDPSTDFEIPLIPRKIRNRKRGSRRKGKRAMQSRDIEDDAMLADYIANMQNESNEDTPFTNKFGARDLEGDENDIYVEEEDEVFSDEPIPDNGPSPDEWNASDIRDFGDLSTSDDEDGELKTILDKRERASGVAYLVVYENQSTDQAKWVRHAALTGNRTAAMIGAWEAEEEETRKNMAEIASASEEDSDDEQDGDIPQREVAKMSDEKIAMMFAKQEQYGFDSNELLLFDGEAGIAEDDGFTGFSRRSRNRKPKIHAPNPEKGQFPNATALADAYDNFDVMDFERPSLQKKPKGRKGKLVIENSDSELEAVMQKAWDNDRVKKKERKQEREELRAQGLLGSKNGKVDMKAKFREGMAIHDVKDAIKEFLKGNDSTLLLVPMDKANRKIVHELANAFNLKSKSVGKGDQRFPVLYRTRGTRFYSESMFDNVESKLARRFLPRMDVGGKRGPRPVHGGGGYGGAAASYRDGDVVGGSAPELGVENKGRAMLEKMGWSSGTALGAINNKGILQPVSHVVKTTKAGLG